MRSGNEAVRGAYNTIYLGDYLTRRGRHASRDDGNLRVVNRLSPILQLVISSVWFVLGGARDPAGQQRRLLRTVFHSHARPLEKTCRPPTTFQLTNIYCRYDLSHVGSAGGRRALFIVASWPLRCGWSWSILSRYLQFKQAIFQPRQSTKTADTTATVR